MMDEMLERLRGKIPKYVIATLPLILKRDTIEKLGELDAEKVGRIIRESVEEINAGSMDGLDTLIQRRLQSLSVNY